MFTCTVKSSYSYSSVRPFNQTTVLVPEYKHRGRMDLLSDSAAVGGEMPRSAGYFWTFFRLAKEATNKLASSWLNLCRTVKTWTTSWCFSLHIYGLLLVQIQCMHLLVLMGFLFLNWLSSVNLCCSSFWSKMPLGLSTMRRLFSIRLRCIHAGGI